MGASERAPAAAPAALLTCAAAKGAAVELCNKGRWLRWAQLRLIYRLLESRFFWGRGDRWAGIPETRPRTCKSRYEGPPALLASRACAAAERSV